MTSQLQLTDRVITVDIDKETIDFGSRRIILGEKGLQGWHGGAEVLRNNRQRLGAHGIFSERGWRGAALITITGWLETDTRALATEAVDDLSEFLADGKDGRIVVRDKDFGNRYSVCYLNGAPDIEWLPGPHERVHVKFTYDLVCTDPRHYEEEPVSATTGLAQPGGGLRFPLFARGDAEVLRRNLCTNPSFEVDVAGWSPEGGATLTASTNKVFVGTRALRMFTTVAGSYAAAFDGVSVTPGLAYNLSAYVANAGIARPVQLSIRWFTSGGAVIGTDYSSPVNDTAEWQRFDVQGIAPPLAETARLRIGIPGTVVNEAHYADAVLFQQASTAGDYFDGSTPSNSTEAYRWTGEPGVSMSEALVPTVPSAGVLDFGILGDDGLATITNPGNADTTVLVRVDGPAAQGFTATEISTGRKLTYTGALGNGDYVELDSSDGTVLLNGYADRGTLLTVRDWFTLDKRQTSSYKIEAPTGSPTMTVSASPAWW